MDRPVRPSKILFSLLPILAGLYSASAVSQDFKRLPPGVYRNEQLRFQVMVGPDDIACLPGGNAFGILLIEGKSCRDVVTEPDISMAELPSALAIVGESDRRNRSAMDAAKANCQLSPEPVESITRKGIELKGARCLDVSKDVQAVSYIFQRPAGPDTSTILYIFMAKYDGPISETIRLVETGIAKFDINE